MDVNFLSISTLVMSLLVVGEAAALLIRTRVIGHGKSWLSIKNDLLLISDTTAGTAMLCMAVIDTNIHRSVLFYIFVAFALLTHSYRDWEYLADRNNPFCDNLPLLIVNNVKLTGIALILIYGLANL